MSVNEYQLYVKKCLSKFFERDSILTEWRSSFGQNIYSPRVDVAVGPFSLIEGERLVKQYDQLYKSHESFFNFLVQEHISNLSNGNVNKDLFENNCREKMNMLFYTNRNARCLFAIEIENKVSRKHLMGGAINCSTLGRIGIAIGFTREMHNAMLNLYRYFEYLRKVEKNSFNTSNLLIVTPDQLIGCIKRFRKESKQITY